MRRTTGMLLLLLIALSLTVAWAEDQGQEAAIIHYDRLKEGKLDGTVQGVRLMPSIGVAGQTSYVRLLNERFESRRILVRVLGLTGPQYDVYIKGEYLGVRSKEELESGLTVSLEGTMIPPALRNYLTRLREHSSAAAKHYEAAMSPDGKLACKLMRAAADWVPSLENGDLQIRTVSLIIVPEGEILNLPGFGMLKPVDYSASLERFGEAVQIMRYDTSRRIHDPVCLMDTLTAITPVDLSVRAPDGFVPGRKSVVVAELKNWTDRSIKMNLKFNVPAGWKVRALSKETSIAPYSSSGPIKYELTVPWKTKPGPPVTADADLEVDSVHLQLHTRVQKK